MRQLDAREIYLLVYGPDGLGAHWKLRALRQEIKRWPEIQEIWDMKHPNKKEEEEEGDKL